AMPPKPAHIAMALASGVFNGKRLDPNPAAPLSVPSIMAKGVFRRELQTVEEKRNKAGDVTGLLQIEQPELIVTVVSLADYHYYEIRPGTLPSGQPDLTQMNVADLIVYYSQSLAQLMSEQFPALHHPANPNHQLSLPKLGRTPFTAQAQAVMAALKL